MTQSLSAKNFDRLQRERNVALRQRDALKQSAQSVIDCGNNGGIKNDAQEFWDAWHKLEETIAPLKGGREKGQR